MRILHLVSCRGWSSDAYWAARAAAELERRGHETWLACREDSEARVMRRARAEGARRIVSLALGARGVRGDMADVRALLAWWRRVDVVHVHRGKEHWLAAAVNRLATAPRPIVRTRHIALPVRAHGPNRWLYGRATALVHAVTEAIRGQLIAAGLASPDRVITIHGGVDAERFARAAAAPATRAALGAGPGDLLVGLAGGLRAMKGHGVVLEALRLAGETGVRPRVAFIGGGSWEARVRAQIEGAGRAGQVMLTGFVEDLPAVLAALDIALYVPLESEGMSRMVFELLAAGRPVIAARVGAVPETLGDGEHARLVPAGDAPALAAALAALAGDAGLRDRLGAAGRRLVMERYSGACLGAALEERYARLLAA